MPDLKDITFLQSEMPLESSFALRIGKTYDYHNSSWVTAVVCVNAEHKPSNTLLMARCPSAETAEAIARIQSPSTPNQTTKRSDKPESI